MQVDFGEEEGIEVQMAPLIDCVFLLLIFFLVATTLKKIDEELPLILPDSQATLEVQQPDDYSVIGIDIEGNFYYNGSPVSVATLQSTLRGIANENPEHKIRLDADKEAQFQKFMQVMDILRFEGLSNVGINTRKDET